MTPMEKTLVILLFLLAIALVIYEMADTFQPHYRDGCSECRLKKAKDDEEKKARQAQLQEEYARRAGMVERDVVPEPPKKKPGGDWKV